MIFFLQKEITLPSKLKKENYFFSFQFVSRITQDYKNTTVLITVILLLLLPAL